MAAQENSMKYELLCVDTKGTTGFLREDKLAQNILSREDLFPNGIQEKNGAISIIKDSKIKISASISLFDAKQESLVADGNSFLISVSGSLESLANLRYKLLAYLKALRFEDVYILTDDVSAEIACKIYPNINKIENYLRKFLLKFFVTKYGEKWWSMTADQTMENKVKTRQDNETVFNALIKNKVYSIDFGDLGRIIYASSSGYNEKENIIKDLMQIKTLDDVKKLQHEVQSNQVKFFQKTFTDKGFRGYWQNLEKIRNKVAHNTLFTLEDLAKSQELVDAVNKILQDADKEIDNLVFEPMLPRNVFADNGFKEEPDFQEEVLMTELAFMEELIKTEKEFKAKKWNGLGLKNFVNNILNLKDEDSAVGYGIARSLKEKGLIELPQVINKYDISVTQIKSTGLSIDILS